VAVCEGATASFTTTASGTAPFSYVWKKGAVVLTTGGRITISSSGNTSTLTISNTQAGDAGTYTVETTGACGTASQSANLSVDSTPPTIILNGNTITLAPPNHQYHTVNVTDLVSGVSDSCDNLSASDVTIAQVTSDELEESPNGADGNTFNDIVISCDRHSVQLRAERDGNNDGRVYTITFTVTDSQGHVGTATAKVTVQVNQNGAAAIDSGPHYIVLTPTCP
jgi:immunoglobulin I-set domain protein